jgi:uncharacterized protein
MKPLGRAGAGTLFVNELLFRLRRSGLPISPAQSILCGQALMRIPWERADVKTALGSIVATNARERLVFQRAFDAYFTFQSRELSLRERLLSAGLSEAELLDVTALLQTPHGYLTRGAEFDAALGRELDALTGLNRPAQAGAHTYRILGKLGQSEALRKFEPLRLFLRDAYGEARAALILGILEEEERKVASIVRELTQDTLRIDVAIGAGADSVLALDPKEFERVKRATQAFAEKLSAGFRARRRKLKKRRLDGPRTFRQAMRTCGLPIELVYRSRSRRRPKLVLICDLSDSVRHAARLLLELVASAHVLFSDTRSFVFVSEVQETTALFHDHGTEEAFRLLASGDHLKATHISNYGRAFRQFVSQHAHTLDRDTTVLILGDGRTNFHDPGLDAVRKLRALSRNVYWLVPEARATWSTGDSAMHIYEPVVSRALEVTTLRDLEEAARMLAR